MSWIWPGSGSDEHELIKSNPELENDPAYADGYEFKYDEQAPGEQ